MDISISLLLFFKCIFLYQYKQSQSFHLPSNITKKIWLHSYPSFSFSWSRTWAKMIREIKMKRNYIPLNNEVLVDIKGWELFWFQHFLSTYTCRSCFASHVTVMHFLEGKINRRMFANSILVRSFLFNLVVVNVCFCSWWSIFTWIHKIISYVFFLEIIFLFLT